MLILLALSVIAQPLAGRDLRDVELGCVSGKWADCDAATSAWFDGAPGLTADPGKGSALLEQSCERREPRACVKLAMIVEEGSRLPRDEMRARQLYATACALGWKLACGDPDRPRPLPTQDAAPAAHEQAPAADRAPLEESCRDGHGDACLGLAGMLMDGQGGRPDPRRAVKLFRAACDGGDLRGCASLGSALLEGRGVKRDEAQAERALSRSCQGPQGYGCAALGSLYSSRNTPEDALRARSALGKACDHGDPKACAAAEALR